MSFFTDRVGPVILGHEGGYTNNPSDPGGETKWGITAETARRYGYKGLMVSLSREQALDIYEQRYFIETRINQVATLAPVLAVKLCDIAVNQGPHFAGEFLQVALNALNRQGKDYPDLKVDGDIGPTTVRALDAYLKVRKVRGEIVLLVAVRSQQVVRYLVLPVANPKLEDFVFGWLIRGGD